MPGKRQGHSQHHKPYRGPWPELHSSIPGRKGPEGPHESAPPHEVIHQTTQVHKIPPQTPKTPK